MAKINRNCIKYILISLVLLHVQLQCYNMLIGKLSTLWNTLYRCGLLNLFQISVSYMGGLCCIWCWEFIVRIYKVGLKHRKHNIQTFWSWKVETIWWILKCSWILMRSRTLYKIFCVHYTLITFITQGRYHHIHFIHDNTQVEIE